MMFPLVLGVAVAVWLLLPRRAPMPASEARALLELSDRDGPEAIRAAHRRLIARVHPDAGGSPELAARVNRARDVLLAERSRTRTRAS